MPDAPWKCSQCGTVNEPAATSCRTCGRWPSLFDLQESAVETPPAQQAPAREVPRYEPREYEATTAPDLDVAPAPTSAVEPEPVPTQQTRGRPSGRGRTRRPYQRFVRLIIPLVALLYFLISSHFSNH